MEMAGTLVTGMATAAIGALTNKLSDMLSSEINMLRQVRRDIGFIENKLNSLKAGIQKMDAMVEADADLRSWARGLQELAYDTEDFIDEFKVHIARPRGHAITDFLCDTIQLITKWREHHEIYDRLQLIKDGIKDADKRGSKFLAQARETSTTEERHDPGQLEALIIEERELVGIDKPREHLIQWLLGGSKSLRVISVVAMGGMGKTTLVKKVYDSPKVSSPGQFDCHAWFTLPKAVDVKMLLRKMITKLYAQVGEDPTSVVKVDRRTGSLQKPSISVRVGRPTKQTKQKREIKTADVGDLILMLRDHLKNKRYVIVFDELWSTTAWESIKHAFPDNGLGSRVVITTRTTEIADIASSLYCKQDALVYNLKGLTQKDSWTLFCKRAFGSEDKCPQNLRGLSEEIVKKCEGLPLAIVTIGNYLATKPKTVEQWRKLHDRFGHEMEANPALAPMKNIPRLSYEDLPYHLKLCFLYLSVFPEDYTIRRGRLVRLWMGEGFVDARHPTTMEDKANEYFNELVTRNMIQVIETDPSGRARSYKVHDIMREVIISESAEENFFYSILDPSSPRPRTDKVRRLTTQCNVHHPLNVSFAHLRSLILFGVFVSSSLKSAKLLRVLDAEGQDIGRRFMPRGQLQHLRYLNLRGTQNGLLPEALSMLQNLEMLDLRDSSIGELPGGIVKLQRLRYLAVYSTGRTAEKLGARGRHGARMPKGISRLKELLTLVLATAEQGFIEELEEMKQLQRLGVTLLTMENDPHFWAAIQGLSYLRSLTVDAEKEDNLMSCMCSSYRLPSTLRSLKLYGLVMEKLPGNIKSLECLAKMVLSGTRLTEDPFPVLETLASLSELQLYEDAFMGEVLHASGGFPMLRTMHLMQLSELELVMVEKEAMPIVESLRIERCGRGWKRMGLIELQMEGSRKSLIVDCDGQGLKK